MKMNMTSEQFVQGFEESAKRLFKMLDTWYDNDVDLREEWIDQLEWMLESFQGVECSPEQQARIDAARSLYRSIRTDLVIKLGISKEILNAL